MRPLAALLLLSLATEPTEPATRSELAQKKMSELVVTMQRLEAPQHGPCLGAERGQHDRAHRELRVDVPLRQCHLRRGGGGGPFRLTCMPTAK